MDWIGRREQDQVELLKLPRDCGCVRTREVVVDVDDRVGAQEIDRHAGPGRHSSGTLEPELEIPTRPPLVAADTPGNPRTPRPPTLVGPGFPLLGLTRLPLQGGDPTAVDPQASTLATPGTGATGVAKRLACAPADLRPRDSETVDSRDVRLGKSSGVTTSVVLIGVLEKTQGVWFHP